MTSHAKFRDDSITAKADNDITKWTGKTFLHLGKVDFSSRSFFSGCEVRA